MKHLFSLFLAACLSLAVHAVNETVWVNQLGSSGDDDVKAIAVAPDGSVFYTGNFGGMVDGVFPEGGSDVFLRKVGPDGATQWTRTFPAAEWAVPSALLVDGSGSRVVLAINFRDTLSLAGLDGGPGSVGSNLSGGLLVMLSSDGAYQWHRYTSGAVASDLTLTTDGNHLLATGAVGRSGVQGFAANRLARTPDSLNSFRFDGSEQTFSITGNPAAFVVSYNLEGAYEWSAIHEATERGFVPTALVAGDDGALFVVGHAITRSESVRWFESGSGDPFLLKLDASGRILWERWLNQIPGLERSPVFVDADVGPSGSLVVAGLEDAVTSGPAAQIIADLRGGDLIVANLSQLDGSLNWQYRAVSSSTHTGAYGLVSDAMGISVTGEFYGQVRFDPSQSAQYGQRDAFLLRLNHVGDYQGLFAFGGFGHDRAQRLALGSGFLVLGGFFESGFDINPFGSTRIPVATAGSKDAFVVAYRFDEPLSVFHAHYHPADQNRDLRIEMGELTSYAQAVVGSEGWPTGPADYPTMMQANEIWRQGEVYRKAGNELPADWIIDDSSSGFSPLGISGGLTFEEILIGTSANRSLTLSNNSSNALFISGISLPDGFFGNWTGTLLSGQSQPVSVVFRPTEARAYGGRLAVNVGGGDAYDYPVSGIGVTSDIADRRLSLSGDLDFSGVAVGQSATRVLRLRNEGGSPVQVASVSLPEGFFGGWTGVVGPGEIIAVPIEFSPVEFKDYDGYVEVISDGEDSPHRRPLFAPGEEPRRAIALSGNLSFGQVIIGEASIRPFVIRNAGNLPLTIAEIVAPVGFRVEGTVDVLDAGEERALNLVLDPSLEGPSGGFLLVYSDAENGTQILTVSAQAAEPRRLLSLTGSLSFGAIGIGEEVSRSFTLRNTGNAPVMISEIAVPDGFSTSAVPDALGRGQQVSVDLSFAPSAAGAFGGFLLIYSNAENSPHILEVVAQAEEPNRIMSLSGDLDFGSVTIGQPQVRAFNVRNTGNVPLVVSDVVAPAGFSVSGEVASIGIGQSQRLDLVFDPAETGDVSGTVTVFSDAANSPQSLAITALAEEPRGEVALTGDLSFGAVTVGASAELPFRLSNISSLPIVISEIVTPSGFIVSGEAGPIPVGGRRDFVLRFAPSAAGAYGGPLVIHSDAIESPLTVPITAQAVDPVRSAALSGSLSFGSVPVGQTEQRLLRVNNTGTLPLTVEDIVVPTGFSVADATGSIPVGGSRVFLITFEPLAVAAYSGFIGVVTDASGGMLTARVSGSGDSGLTLSGSLSFGSVLVGETAARTLTIRNNREATPLQVTGISLPLGFSGNWIGNLEAGESQIVSIVFGPTAFENYTGEITVHSDRGSATLSINGAGAAATRQVSIVSGSGWFGDVPIGATRARAFTIRNTGNSPLTVSSIALPAGYSSSYSSVLEAGASDTVEVTFAPDAVASFSGNLQVISDADNGAVSRSINGRGIAATRTISLTGSLDYGQVPIGFGAELTFTIRNSGNLPISVSGIAYPSGFSGSWSGEIAPGQTVTVLVVFTPTEERSYSGSLTVLSDASSGAATLTVTGLGFAPSE